MKPIQARTKLLGIRKPSQFKMGIQSSKPSPKPVESNRGPRETSAISFPTESAVAPAQVNAPPALSSSQPTTSIPRAQTLTTPASAEVFGEAWNFADGTQSSQPPAHQKKEQIQQEYRAATMQRKARDPRHQITSADNGHRLQEAFERTQVAGQAAGHDTKFMGLIFGDTTSV